MCGRALLVALRCQKTWCRRVGDATARNQAAVGAIGLQLRRGTALNVQRALTAGLVALQGEPFGPGHCLQHRQGAFTRKALDDLI
jgi:hypothetical protein